MAIAPPISNPSAQTTGADGVFTYMTYQGQITDTNPVLVAPADPDRLVLTIQSTLPVENWAASVARDTGGFGWHGVNGSYSLTMHHMTYPGIVQAAWYVSAEVAMGFFRVYSITRNEVH